MADSRALKNEFYLSTKMPVIEECPLLSGRALWLDEGCGCD